MFQKTSFRNELDLSVDKWLIPEGKGPKGCNHWDFCKGIDNLRNQRNESSGKKRRYKTHTSEENCPYNQLLVNIFLIKITR